MKQKLLLLFLVCPFILVYGQHKTSYDVYALKIRESGAYSQASSIAVGANEQDSVRVCNMFWLLKDKGDKTILVDVGFVDTSSRYNIKYITPADALSRMNLEPEDITDIIVTHPHIDHIGDIDTYTNATVWMQKDDYSYFTGGAWQGDGKRVGFSKEDVRNLVDINLDGRLKLIDGDSIEIMPGIRVFTGSKHTFENQYVLVESNSRGKKVLLASDAIWFYYNLEHLLPVTLAYDPDAYVEGMKRIGNMMTDSNYIIPGHDDLLFSKFPEVREWIIKIE